MSSKSKKRRPEGTDTWADLVPRRWLEWLDTPVSASMHKGDQVLHVEEFRSNDDLVIRAEVPGVDPDKDVDVHLRDHVLQIRAQRTRLADHEEDMEYRSEFRYGSFFRAVPLPPNAKESDVTARYRDGVLEVRVPMEPMEASVESKGTRIAVDR